MPIKSKRCAHCGQIIPNTRPNEHPWLSRVAAAAKIASREGGYYGRLCTTVPLIHAHILPHLPPKMYGNVAEVLIGGELRRLGFERGVQCRIDGVRAVPWYFPDRDPLCQ